MADIGDCGGMSYIFFYLNIFIALQTADERPQVALHQVALHPCRTPKETWNNNNIFSYNSLLHGREGGTVIETKLNGTKKTLSKDNPNPSNIKLHNHAFLRTGSSKSRTSSNTNISREMIRNEMGVIKLWTDKSTKVWYMLCRYTLDDPKLQ
jgi:hypothetical protein